MPTFPKPLTRKTVKAKARRADAIRLKAFRLAVWRREQAKVLGLDHWSDPARCQSCGVWVWPESETAQGEIHHRIGRRAKGTRYDPQNGVLLCHFCHRKVTEHQIPCP